MYLVSRTETFAKLFFIVSFTGLFMYVALAFYSFHTAYTTVSQIGKYQERLNKFRSLDVVVDRFENDLKYILVWTIKKDGYDDILGFEGQGPFIENNCPEINCFITTNKTILNEDYTNFDAIIFNMSVLWQWKDILLPQQRAKRQKYVFYGMQPSDDHPICNIRVDNYFNWTWTYKFYSDVFSPFIEVKDLNGTVVAPSRNVIWNNELTKTTNVEVIKLNTKTKALAWIMDKCNINPSKMIAISKLKRALKEQSLVFDIYGCGNLKCPRGGCLKAVQKDYYFYLAYEGSVSEDYVTAEVLKAYDNDAVPIVVGGADYSKFLPENSYINFQYYTEEKLAAFMYYIIRNPSAYNIYFNWKMYYTIQKPKGFKGYCELCRLLNDNNKFDSFSTYEKFRTWWYFGSLKEKCYPKGAEKFSELTRYFNDTVGKNW